MSWKILAAATFALACVPISAAEEIKGFKKATIMATVNGKPQLIETSQFALPIQARLNGMFVEFEREGVQYKLKASDTVFDGTVQRTCLAGELKSAPGNETIAASVMGSGESSCVKN